MVDNALPLFSERLARSLRSIGLDAREFEFQKRTNVVKWVLKLMRSKAKIIHYLWGGSPLIVYIVPKLLGKKVIIHWVGTDVLMATASKSLHQKLIFRIVDLHLTVAEHLANELEILGIRAKVIPLVPDRLQSIAENIPWPISKSVYVYLPKARQEIYGANDVFQLAKEMPDIEFLITAHDGSDAPHLPNLVYLNQVSDEEMELIWGKVKAYLRLTWHDGMPQTIIEALTRGRYVVWTYEFPHCIQVHSRDDAKEALRVALAQEFPNAGGIAYAKKNFSPIKMAEDLRQEYYNILSPSK